MALMVRQTTAGQTWVAIPNHALTPRQTRQLLLAAAGISGGIALAFAAFGAWPVLPFAGLEVTALWLALRHLQRHIDDEERLEMDDSHVILTRTSCGRRECWKFPRYWLQLRIERTQPTADSRLFIRSHGREVEIGQLLTEGQRRELARMLREKLDKQKQ